MHTSLQMTIQLPLILLALVESLQGPLKGVANFESHTDQNQIRVPLCDGKRSSKRKVICFKLSHAPEAVWVRSCNTPSSCKKASFLLTSCFF